MNFSRSALFHIKTRVCVKYLVNACSTKTSKLRFVFKSVTLSLVILNGTLILYWNLKKFYKRLPLLRVITSCKIWEIGKYFPYCTQHPVTKSTYVIKLSCYFEKWYYVLMPWWYSIFMLWCYSIILLCPCIVTPLSYHETMLLCYTVIILHCFHVIMFLCYIGFMLNCFGILMLWCLSYLGVVIRFCVTVCSMFLCWYVIMV